MTAPTLTHPADTLPRAFVVGCQKSGTSWMQALLNAHPEICARGEACFGNTLVPRLGALTDAYNRSQRAGTTNAFEPADALQIMRFAICLLQRKWFDAVESKESIRVIAEKTPEQALTLDSLATIFPGMRVIHIIRDGRDGVVSGWHHNLREDAATFKSRFPTLASYTRYFVEHHWVPYITAARRWGREHPEQYLELRYEDALDSPHEHARDIFTFLGVDASEVPVRQAVERASFRSMSGGRAQGETDNASHMRKGTSGGWREDLDQASIEVFEQIGGTMLDTLGYPRAAAMST
ncbi:MAG: sulfotransferase [Phycisphaerales bacterium JB052]